MSGQIIDATVIEARRPHLTRAEKDTIKGGGTPAEWTPARRAQIDRNILSRHRAPAPAVTILTPDALRLRHLPIADCARYDSLRRAC